jgi:T5SS/PEP-CTERM-associated repeat protein
VGHDGGSGYLVVDDTPAASNTNGAVTRANLGGGLVLGSGAGSYGGLQVLAGGKSFTYTSCHGSCVVEPVQLGVAGGTGEALVSGTGSIWYVSGDTSPVSGGVLGDPGDLQLGYSGKGVLTINDGGKVTLGQAAIDEIPPDNFSFQIVDFVDSVGDLHIAAQAGSEGVLNIGGAEGGAAQASGILAAAHAIFGAGAGRINFNHLDTAYQFDVVTEGAGKVNNYAGTTWLNGINTYSGETNLYGGALGLSNN